MNQSTKKLIFIKIIPSAVVFIVLFLMLYHPPLELFPANDTYLDYEALSDGVYTENGSEAALDTTHGHMHFKYTLSDESSSPFAWILFHAHELARSINLKSYKYIDIDLDPEKSDDFTFSVYMYIPHYSDPEMMETHRPYAMKCRVKEKTRHYHYPLSDLATPSWWFTMSDTREESIPRTDWTKMTHITFSDFGLGAIGNEQSIFINRIRFTDNLFIDLLFALLIPVIYLLSLSAFKEFKRKRKNRSIKKGIYYRKNGKSYSDGDDKKLLDYLAENYGNPLLSLDLIKKEIGLNAFQCNEIIIDRFSIKYKQYINKIRVVEAKRLLKDSNKQISEIAELVGYCYSNSFSRAFRNIEGVSPNEYRTKNEEQ